MVARLWSASSCDNPHRWAAVTRRAGADVGTTGDVDAELLAAVASLGRPAQLPPASARSEVNRLRSASRETTTPTMTIIGRAGSRRAISAAKGAASTPPSTKPVMIGQSDTPIVATKVADTATVTKTSARLAEPIASRGTLPRPIRVEVTIG